VVAQGVQNAQGVQVAQGVQGALDYGAVVVGAAADRPAEGLISALGREVATGLGRLTIGKLLLPVVGIAAVKTIPFFVIPAPPSGNAPSSNNAPSSGKPLPVLYVLSSQTPLIERFTEIALKHNYPDILTYDASESRKNRRRQIACGRVTRRRLIGLESSYVGPGPFHGQRNECDEYPYAQTKEGGDGTVGVIPPPRQPKLAAIAAVPSGEQRIQGGVVGAFFDTLKDGDQFRVVPINDAPYNGPDPLYYLP
jgi:hypothetical protein